MSFTTPHFPWMLSVLIAKGKLGATAIDIKIPYRGPLPETPLFKVPDDLEIARWIGTAEAALADDVEAIARVVPVESGVIAVLVEYLFSGDDDVSFRPLAIEHPIGSFWGGDFQAIARQRIEREHRYWELQGRKESFLLNAADAMRELTDDERAERQAIDQEQALIMSANATPLWLNPSDPVKTQIGIVENIIRDWWKLSLGECECGGPATLKPCEVCMAKEALSQSTWCLTHGQLDFIEMRLHEVASMRRSPLGAPEAARMIAVYEELIALLSVKNTAVELMFRQYAEGTEINT